jgi:hypothetical protein
MISREEAISWLDPVDELGTAPEFDVLKAINLIYDSIGSCKECKHYDTKLGKTPNEGHCKVHRDSEQILWVNIKVDDNWFCADYERGTNERR